MSYDEESFKMGRADGLLEAADEIVKEIDVWWFGWLFTPIALSLSKKIRLLAESSHPTKVR